jgi:hypothetical protein
MGAGREFGVFTPCCDPVCGTLSLGEVTITSGGGGLGRTREGGVDDDIGIGMELCVSSSCSDPVCGTTSLGEVTITSEFGGRRGDRGADPGMEFVVFTPCCAPVCGTSPLGATTMGLAPEDC